MVLEIYPKVTWNGFVESISPATRAEFAILPPQNASAKFIVTNAVACTRLPTLRSIRRNISKESARSEWLLDQRKRCE